MDNPYSSYRSLFPVLSNYVHLASCSSVYKEGTC